MLALFVSVALGAAPLPPGAVEAWREMGEVQRLEASFIQTRTSALLKEPLESRGTLRFERPDKLAWTTTTPGRSKMVIQGTRVGMSYPDLGVVDEIDLADSPDVAGLITGMMAWLSADLDTLSQGYTVEWTDAPGPGQPALARLTPHDPAIASIIATMELQIGGSPLGVQRVQMTEPDGDLVTIRVIDPHPNGALPADAFEVSAR